MIPLYFSLIGSAFFYFFLPLSLIIAEIGAQRKLRKQWLAYSKGKADFFRGFRFSSERENLIWLQRQGDSVKLNLNHILIYKLLPGRDRSSKYRLVRIPRKEFSYQTDGQELILLGNKKNVDGMDEFRGTRENPVSVLVCSSNKHSWEECLRDALMGDHFLQSEWLTRSIVIGAAYSILFFSLSLQLSWPQGYRILHLIFALIPLYPLIPPGILLYFLAIFCWNRLSAWPKRISTVVLFALMYLGNGILLFQFLKYLMQRIG